MVSLVGIVAGIALVLAVVVTAAFIGVCLLVARLTRVAPERSRHGAHGAGGQATAMRQPPGGRRRAGSGVPVSSRRGHR